MSKKKSLDETITTLGNFRVATEKLHDGTQMFVQLTGHGDDDSALIEVTEMQLVLPKHRDDEPYLILRCK